VETVLGLDVTTSPARAVVARVEGRRVEVVESLEIDLGEIFSPASLLPPPPAAAAANAETSGTDAAPAALPPPQASLRQALAAIRTPWSNAVLVVPPHEYLSVNLDLPFQDQKNLARVVDLEVQDLVPFDVHDFFIEHRALAPATGGASDIHVGLVPRAYVQNLLQVCRESEFEPAVVSTPTGMLSALFALGADFFPADAILVLADPPNFGVLVRVDGIVRTDRAFAPDAGLSEEQWFQRFVNEVRLTIAAAERRYGRALDRAFGIGDTARLAKLQQGLRRTVERVAVSEFVQVGDAKAGVAALATYFGDEAQGQQMLTNFRSREFGYSPQLRALAQSLLTVVPLAVMTLLCFLISAGIIYVIREHRISAARAEIREAVLGVLPSGTDATPGEEVNLLSRATGELETQLQGLGSLSQVTPLDALRGVSADLPMERGITNISKIAIRENKITLEGSARDYTALDALEKVFRDKKSLYCRVKLDNTGGSTRSSNSIDFTMLLHLCE